MPDAGYGSGHPPEPSSDFESWCVREEKSRIIFQLVNDVVRCLEGGPLSPDGDCDEGFERETAVWNSAECTSDDLTAPGKC